MNRLKNENSPYLLQHAENPVDWYPWGEEAFSRAVREDKPVFLSIGYSSCHWCHVMERESFSDGDIAEILNRAFICVKVDREERPDVDSVYMSACQAMIGSGGWPLTIITTPKKEPFFAGTYFPRRGRDGMPGLEEVLLAVEERWRDDRSGLLEQGRHIVAFVRGQNREEGGGEARPELLLKRGEAYFRQSFDAENGGFGYAPKFPSPHNLLFLLREGGETNRKMAEKTLVQMYRGGIFDHVGGGFCRYSTDERWLIPHFEKMLYDNALLLMAYAQAFRETGNPLYAQVADRVVRYVLRELTDEEGGFYCSQDADAEGREGAYYVFTPDEIRGVLGKGRGETFCRHFDISERGNFEGKNVPNLLRTAEYAEKMEEYLFLKLYRYRGVRLRLFRDDKVLTGWNGLMIAALSRASRLLGRPEYLEASRRAADFVWENLYADGRLLNVWRKGRTGGAAVLDDYAFYCWGLLECYAADFDASHLKRAKEIGGRLLELFFDEREGGCWLSAEDGEQLFVRLKETYDGAIPSGNSAALLVMRKLAVFTGEKRWREAEEKQRRFLLERNAAVPQGSGCFLWQLAEEKRNGGMLVCTAAEASAVSRRELIQMDLDVLVKTEQNADMLTEVAPYLAGYPIPEKGALYYYCDESGCHPPADSLKKIKR